MNPDDLSSFWSLPSAELVRRLGTTERGLTSEEALRRCSLYGADLLRPKKRSDWVGLLLGQFKSPIVLILLLAAGLSFFLHDQPDALIILGIILVSGFLGFWQERGAAHAVEELLSIVRTTVAVLRDGRSTEVPIEEVVPGDVLNLSAGSSLPGDCLILASKDLYVDEATLTGETFPVEKTEGALPVETPLGKRINSLFLGTHVVSGTATVLVVHTGRQTEFGKVSERLRLRPPETEFERGVRRFGYLLMEVALLLVLGIFAVNVHFHRPVLESFMFAMALAVGLTPQLLPAIISVNLSHGAKRMAEAKVIVKRLASIENFGSMNVLCSDKTGTLTEGVVRVHAALDAEGKESERVLLCAYLNASLQSGFVNPIDQAVRTYREFDVSGYRRVDEVPYDFLRKRLSVLVEAGDDHLVITKGSLRNVLEVCNRAELSGGQVVDLPGVRRGIEERFREFSGQGHRVLGVACRSVGGETRITRESERDMTFLGYVAFLDPPKPGITETLGRLRGLGVSMKMITGDNELVATNVARQIGLVEPEILTGPEIRRISDEALASRINTVEVFAEVEPNQKERIILALKKAGNVVGYMGDGINDASALHAADVGISVDDAVDVAKEAADIVLLERDLNVLIHGVREGRATFANTLKYVFMATSANFGNMFSMAGASLFLPFLPLLPKQILLANLMTDFPEMTIATDSVDEEMIEAPRRWNMSFIKKFMVTFGVLSSVFDYLTFGVLLLILRADAELFRSAWFVESVVSAALVVLVIRSRRPFFMSRPGRHLMIATLVIVAAAVAAPLAPGAEALGFRPLPRGILAALAVIVGLYILTAEIAKRVFYARVQP
ncbi:MAG: magnesium-translocating P-type ATPase [Phycisphaerae bacterium]|nr:magnesium-translocating P-type ATPase [Phycisphaerae bacterium]